MRPLSLSRIEEPQVRDNFKSLDDEFKSNPIINGQWRLFDREFTAVGDYTIYHKLGFKPLDLIVTYSTASYSIDWSSITEDTITLNISGIGRLRFILGRMK